VLNIPVPRILSWSSDAENPVGAEYIIEEVASGKPLGGLWSSLSKESQFDVVSQIVDLELKLSEASFRRHGCIYYKTDLERKGIATDSFMEDLVTHDHLKFKHSVLAKYAMGPLTTAKLWQGQKNKKNPNLGPCK
jgi:hypothetical protein